MHSGRTDTHGDALGASDTAQFVEGALKMVGVDGGSAVEGRDPIEYGG